LNAGAQPAYLARILERLRSTAVKRGGRDGIRAWAAVAGVGLLYIAPSSLPILRSHWKANHYSNYYSDYEHDYDYDYDYDYE
jgi:hypothetical protein